VKKADTLKQNWEFRRLYQSGRSAVSPALVVYCRKNRTGGSRLGLTVSVKLGKAVVRNRIKRRLREVYRLGRVKPGYDLILVGRSQAKDMPFPRLMDCFRRCCVRLNVWEGEA